MSPSSPLIVPQQANNAKFTTLFKRNIGNVWYQQEAQEPGFNIWWDKRGNLCIQRGECAVFDQIYGKVYRSPYLISALDHITMLFCAI
jgi:hypothetical protein